jgi:hypothetical protein
MRSLTPILFVIIGAIGATVGCNTLASNDAATAACASAGPGSGATNASCVDCCKKNGGTGRLSDAEKCLCIGK